MNRRLRHRDLSLAWNYAANFSLHEETPGPVELNAQRSGLDHDRGAGVL